jgi:GMP synthase (glutamine-hydrolysing)
MADELVIILDFGGQYKELIARRVRECGVFSRILPGNTSTDEIKALRPVGLILTGGPDSVYSSGASACDTGIFELGIPVLGICYGMHLMAHLLGGIVSSCDKSEYGLVDIRFDTSSRIFKNINETGIVLMNHTDRVCTMSEDFKITAATQLCPISAFEDEKRNLFGVQFHPEVENTPDGTKIISNFLYNVCNAKGGYSLDNWLNTQIEEIRSKVGSGRVLLGLSGGVDSSVCAALLAKAIPGQLTCIYVDHGLMRKNETEEIRAAFQGRELDLVCVDARERFLSKLAGVTDPETKRKIIGREFVLTFQDEAEKHGNAEYLAQGTIYPDVVESGVNSAVIKSHHNVGGLPEDLRFKGIIEPLRSLFKDEVRKIGELLGLPAAIVNRQPFPGPGLAIRVIGEVTAQKLDILREADAIVRQEIMSAGENADQYFAILTNTKSVGVMGDGRTYEYMVAIRAVVTKDFMTCEVARLPWDLLTKISSRIVNEVRGINRVVYDITSKPPATIEWE